jgi:hypothetical protein
VGRFIYDGSVKVDFDDRLLAHLQVVITQKLRRGESFPFTWRNEPSLGDGRTTVWLNPNASLVYKYHGSRQPVLNRAWLESLTHAANSTAGLQIIPEPESAATGDILTG